MKQYFKPTAKKILGVIILLFLFSMLGLLPYISNPMSVLNGQNPIMFGWPLSYVALQGASINNFNIVYLLIDIIIFYFAICFVSMAFGGRGAKKETPAPEVKQELPAQEGVNENVPNSDSGRGDTSTSDEAQP